MIEVSPPPQMEDALPTVESSWDNTRESPHWKRLRAANSTHFRFTRGESFHGNSLSDGDLRGDGHNTILQRR